MGCETYGVAALAELQIDLDLSLMLFYGAHPFSAHPPVRALRKGVAAGVSRLQSQPTLFFRQGHKVCEYVCVYV